MVPWLNLVEQRLFIPKVPGSNPGGIASPLLFRSWSRPRAWSAAGVAHVAVLVRGPTAGRSLNWLSVRPLALSWLFRWRRQRGSSRPLGSWTAERTNVACWTSLVW